MKRIVALVVCSALSISFTGCRHKHDLKEKAIFEATCTTEGKMEEYCTKCDYTESYETDALGHDLGDTKVVKKATCKKEGKEERICSTCGYKEEKIIKPAHTFEEEIITEATCKKEGEKELICTVCGHEETKEIAKLNHVFIDQECVKCKAYKVTEITANQWYEYKQNNVIKCQNALVYMASPLGKGYMVTYYPICSSCHIAGGTKLAGPEVNYPVTQTYNCDYCDNITYINFKIQY